MKKFSILTSLLVLSACGGGSGGHHSVSESITNSANNTPRPTISVQAFNASSEVNAKNTDVTGMVSYTVDYADSEEATKNLMKQYVNNKLNSNSSLFVRVAAKRPATSKSADTEFIKADRAIQAMKQVVYDMVMKSEESSDALTQYVTKYQSYVADAFKLLDLNVADNTSVSGLITAFNEYKTDKGLSSDTVLQKMDEFDATEFGITKHRMDEVKLRDTGYDAYFKFTLDDMGVIEDVSLWENPSLDYGTHWNNTKIVLNNNGEAVSAEWDGETFEYKNSDAGYVVRNGNSKGFTNTVYKYTFDLGNHNLDEGIIKSSKFAEVDILAGEDLSIADAKAKIKDYIIEKVNKILHSQSNEDSSVLNNILAVANYYIDNLDTLVTDVPNPDAINQAVAMNSFGKDEGLRFTDFGYAKMIRTMGDKSATQYLTYMGGYDQRRMDNSVVNKYLDGAVFTGTAVVTVEDKDKRSGAETNHAVLYKDTNAQLAYDVSGNKATHTLTMSNLKAVDGDMTANLDWYSTVVQGTEGNPTLTYKFNDNGKNIDDNYKFFVGDAEGNISRGGNIVKTDNTNVDIDMNDGNHIGDNYSLHGYASAEYYGADKTKPTEAISGFYMSERYVNSIKDDTIKHELSVYGAFGGKKE